MDEQIHIHLFNKDSIFLEDIDIHAFYISNNDTEATYYPAV